MQSPARQNATTLFTPATATQETSQNHQTMRAMVHDQYGALDLLAPRDISKPLIKDDEVLLQVRAAGLHIGDCFSVRGAPLVMRIETGLFKPKSGIPGFDVAGRVEAVGKQVTQFVPGDEVFGQCNGACAEYVCVKQSKLAKKPTSLTFEQAASMPTSALAALHALRDVAKVQPGQHILINGASGGVGTFAVQIAKSLGAHVTGVCSTASEQMVRGLGADHVIDYTRSDFTDGMQRYDLILDNVENRSLTECRRVLTFDGMLICNSGTGAQGLALLIRLIKPLLLSPFVRHALRRYLSVSNHTDLVVLKELVDNGRVTPVIDKTYALNDTSTALGYIEDGHARGKVVITV